MVADEHRRALFGFELREGIPKYEAMVEVGEDVSFPWSMDVIAHYQHSFISGWGLARARRQLGAGEIRQLLDAVRTRLLNFTLELETANPNAGEAVSGEEPVPLQDVNAAFKVYVMGDNNVVNAAGRDAHQDVLMEGAEWESLRAELGRLGVPDGEISELRDALASDASLGLPPGALGPSASAWYQRLVDAVAPRCGRAPFRGHRRGDCHGAPEVRGCKLIEGLAMNRHLTITAAAL